MPKPRTRQTKAVRTKNAGAKRTPARSTSAPNSTSTLAPRSASVEAKPLPNHITAQAIADAAYFLWQQRGGNEVVNWLEAEAMLKNGVAARA